MKIYFDQVLVTFALSACLVIVPFSTATSIQLDTITSKVGNSFSLAREKASEKQYNEAHIILCEILQQSPSNIEARILLGRIFAWEGKYDSARIQLKQALLDNPQYEDAFKALIDVELWNVQFSQALNYSNEALSYFPLDEELLIKKIRSLKGLNRELEALHILNKLQDIHPSASGIELLRQEISAKTMLQSIGFNYAIDAFAEQKPWQYTSFQYSRRTPYGPAFARLNYTYRFEQGGTQVEFDFYPRISDGKYAYLNYGISNNALFPKHRIGGEFFSGLPVGFEGSLGFRYLSFSSGSSIVIYTGTLGYYWGNYWFSFRPYITPGDNGTSKSASLTIRYFLSDAEDYFSLRFGAGFTPDERLIQSSSDPSSSSRLYYLDSQTAGIGFQKAISIQYLLVGSLDYTNQEKSYNLGSYLKMYSLSLGIRVRF